MTILDEDDYCLQNIILATRGLTARILIKIFL